MARSEERFGEALSYAYAAQRLAPVRDGLPHDLAGSIWEALADSKEAELAYVNALKAGSLAAAPALEELYVARHGTREGFGEDLDTVRTFKALP